MAGFGEIHYAFWFQSLQPKGYHYNELWPCKQIHLMADQTVVFDNGQAHGSWIWGETGEKLTITFHHKGIHEKAITHEFHRIANSSTLALVRANGRFRADAIIVQIDESQTDGMASDSKRPRMMQD